MPNDEPVIDNRDDLILKYNERREIFVRHSFYLVGVFFFLVSFSRVDQCSDLRAGDLNNCFYGRICYRLYRFGFSGAASAIPQAIYTFQSEMNRRIDELFTDCPFEYSTNAIDTFVDFSSSQIMDDHCFTNKLQSFGAKRSSLKISKQPEMSSSIAHTGVFLCWLSVFRVINLGEIEVLGENLINGETRKNFALRMRNAKNRCSGKLV